jgi:glycogen phosphorylase
MLSSSQARIHAFRVTPDLPAALSPLQELAQNLWWTWNPDAVSLFERLDPALWIDTDCNPVKFLGIADQRALDRAAADPVYLKDLGEVRRRMQEELTRPAWFDRQAEDLRAKPPVGSERPPFRVAYFCAEFGLASCFQIYSGGLGVLAGDHLKAASELGLPLVGVGLLYRCGYFHQSLGLDGSRREGFPEIDFANQPVRRVTNPATGKQLVVEVELPGRRLLVGVWHVNVGRIPLYLLDTNLPENSEEDRQITRNLYLGDVETRIKQEIVLGIGGVRALAAVGIDPSVCHLNEGHSAFLTLERIRLLRERHQVSFDEAREAARAGHLFTTHTPLPAGIDRFHPSLVERYLGDMVPALGLDLEGLLALGRENVSDRNEWFSMAVLAIRTSRACNGVSKLHGEVSRGMWAPMWPGVPRHEVPIGHVTNGVHARTWLSAELGAVLDRGGAPSWREDPTDTRAWEAVEAVPDAELWAMRQRQRASLIEWCRGKIRRQLESRGAGVVEIDNAVLGLDPRALTIGFARRFAAYKRGTLILRNRERLKRLLHSADRPVQLLVSGKSHPSDGAGKELIREIVRFARDEGGSTRVVFLDDYDMEIARRLVQGCDVWLNTPRRGLEASGTSGMKAAMNGVINVSILDGWWDEGFEAGLGFAIGRGESYMDQERDAQDDFESRALYDVLEHQVVPEFYARDGAGVPTRWVRRMKRCITRLGPEYNTGRMVAQYAGDYYFPLYRASVAMGASDLRQARGVAARIDFYRAHWADVRIESVESNVRFGVPVPVRGEVRVTATVALGELRPSEVSVQLYFGELNYSGDMVTGDALTMTLAEDRGGGRYVFTGSFTPQSSGRRGYAVRVLPRDERLATPFIQGLIAWENGVAPPVQLEPAT